MLLLAPNQTVLLGPPGTGKTTSVLDSIEHDLLTYQPEEIALVSFTRKAVREAAERMADRFQFNKSRLPYFQTVHSLCYRSLACQKSDLMTRLDYAELGEMLGYNLNADISVEDGALIIPDQDKGGKLLFLDNLARTTRRPLREVWKQLNLNIMWAEVERFCNTYSKYKEHNGKLDFTDLLECYVAEGTAPEVKVAYVDEAQDLSAVQWAVLQRAFAHVEKLVIAGDDDQSIFKWSGADLGAFMALGGTIRTLAHSYRLPQAVHGKAKTIIQRVKTRYNKEFTATEKPGTVTYAHTLDNVKINEDESTLILVRNVYLLKNVYEYLRRQGINFTGRKDFAAINADHVQAIVCWERLRKGDTLSLEETKNVYEHLRVGDVLARNGKTALNKMERSDENFSWETLRDHYGLLALPIWHKALLGIPLEKREYYISLLRRNKKLTAESNVHVNTIHGVKGGEADHVVVLSDMSRKTYEEMLRDPCSEHRTAYVAVTRSKNKLTIVLPQNKYSYSY